MGWPKPDMNSVVFSTVQRKRKRTRNANTNKPNTNPKPNPKTNNPQPRDKRIRRATSARLVVDLCRTGCPCGKCLRVSRERARIGGFKVTDYAARETRKGEANRLRSTGKKGQSGRMEGFNGRVRQADLSYVTVAETVEQREARMNVLENKPSTFNAVTCQKRVSSKEERRVRADRERTRKYRQWDRERGVDRFIGRFGESMLDVAEVSYRIMGV